MQLSSRQWSIIREICAEQARAVVDKNYNPSVQAALDLGLDSSQIEELVRITSTTVRKHMKQKDNSACPTVFVAASEFQARALEDARDTIAKLNKEADDSHNRERALLAQLGDFKELRTRLEEQNDRLRQADHLIKQLNLRVVQQAQDIRDLTNPVGEASFRNHSGCSHQPSEFRILAQDFGSDVVIQALVQKQFGPLKEGDKIVTNKEVFTWFMGQWRRKSELEGFASAKKYT